LIAFVSTVLAIVLLATAIACWLTMAAGIDFILQDRGVDRIDYILTGGLFVAAVGSTAGFITLVS
jgi:hypothetical protein